MSIHTEGPHLLRQVTGTSTLKARASSGLRKLSADMNDAYPEMDVHQHLTDAARELDSGRTHSAQRHVNAAIFGLTPLQLRRHGVQDDAGHMRGKAFMQQAHRHLLLIKDIEDVHGSNRDLRQQRHDDQEQEKAMRAAAPPVAVAASWDTHLDAIELATFAGKPPGSGHNFAKLQGVLAKRGAKNPGALAAYIGRKKYGRKGFAKLGRGSSHASQLDALELAYRFKHGWIRLDGMGSAAEVAASGAGFPLETRPKRKGPNALERAAARLTDAGPKTVGKGVPPHPTPAQALASEKADARKYAAAMGRNKAKAVAKVVDRQKVYRTLRRQGHSHSKAMAVLRSVGRQFQAGSAVPPAGFSWESADRAIGLASGPLPYSKGPDETVHCPVCGKWDAPDARFCDQCGNRLPDSAFADLANLEPPPFPAGAQLN